MATANINVRTDAAIKAQAQQIFESIGLDLSTAVNLFLRQTVKANNLPFVVGVHTEENITAKRASHYGVWKGKYSLPKDFDEPLDDFKEYM
ncbi:MAG: type II toxin-antitoxin system RelB/DinJ family antitoxin [Peptococcaceae bacterium]|jgi:DNA-damage-inducible protein J|nr:type II toxin-antitoxin system RelB/DinJ family antitoxin [Peptococcaceae bacterium]